MPFFSSVLQEQASWRVVTLSLTMRAEAVRDAEGWSGACGGDDDDGDDCGGDYSLIFTRAIEI